MEKHRYQLENYKGMATRHRCPECESKKSFTLYIDNSTNEPLDYTVGRCERLDKCGYHLTPKQYFERNGITPEIKPYTPQKATEIKEISFIDKDIFNKSLNKPNNFRSFLYSRFDKEQVDDVCDRYNLGTSKRWNGATVFWQQDLDGNVRTGKIMQYDEATGKRIKLPYNHVTWAHKALKVPNFELNQCFYGLHLIKGNTMPIAVCESEKTAMIASLFMPNMIWLACGSLTMLSVERCKVLAGRNVVLYPDVNGFLKWSAKAKEIKCQISVLLERNASDEDREQGADLADFLLKIKTPSKPTLPPELVELQKFYSELEQAGKIAEKHHDRVRRLWGNATDCLRNKGVGINKAILELTEYKQLIIK